MNSLTDFLNLLHQSPAMDYLFIFIYLLETTVQEY